MANIAIFRINYKSDFILTLNSDAGWLTPFCIKFWTGAPRQAYFVGFDGITYTHCAPVDDEPTKLRVQFDDHHLPIGDLKFQIAYHFTVADFPTSVEDEVLNQASVIIEVDDTPAQVMLDLNGETAPEIEFSLPAYTNEAQRITNEEARIAAEQQRIANEEARIAAETVRQQNEEQRINQEQARVNEFARLKRESEQATTDANAAATLSNEKAQLAADKAALAQAAATLANEKAQLAADKAALAQAAATLANEKAALAQQKAEYAQTQGDYAKEQGIIAEDDHARAEQDHERAESDHAALENVPESVPSTSPTDLSGNVEDVYLKNRSNNNPQAPRTLARLVTDSAKNRPLDESLTRLAEYQSLGFPAFSTSVDYAEGDPCFHDRRLYKAKAGGHSAGTWNAAHFEEFSVKEYTDAHVGIFDVSANNGGAVFASLQALLSDANLNTLIPAPFRRGGITITFIQGENAQSSDNKYVQYRCIADEFTTDTTQWAVCDDSIYVENPEFIRVVTDKDGRILACIKTDGSIEWAVGVPKPIREYIEVGLDTKVDKEENKSLIDEDFANSISYIENPEFGCVFLDNENRVLFGVQKDGNFTFGCGVPQQVIDYIEEKIADLSLDEYEDIVAFLNGLEEGDKTLQTLLNEKVDKEKGKSLIDEEYASTKSTIDNSEFLDVTLDAEDKVLEGIKKDGTKFLNLPLELQGTKFKTIDNPEWIYLLLDSECKILKGLRRDGTVYDPLNSGGASSGKFDEAIAYMKALVANGGKSERILNILKNMPKGNYTKEGYSYPTTGYMSFHDDDTIDPQIPVSNIYNATPETRVPAGNLHRSGFASFLYPFTKSIIERHRLKKKLVPNQTTHGYDLVNDADSIPINGNIVYGLAAEGQRTGLIGKVYSDKDEFDGTLNLCGQIASKLHYRCGWDIMCHSMTARYMGNSYWVESLNDPLVAQIEAAATASITPNLWNSSYIHCDDNNQDYEYRMGDNNTPEWHLVSKHYIRPYLAKTLDANAALYFNPRYSEDFQVGEWVRRAKIAGLPFIDCGVTWGTSGSKKAFLNRFKYINNWVSSQWPDNGFNGVPFGRSTIDRLKIYTVGTNAWLDEKYTELKNAIDTAIANGTWIITNGHIPENYEANYYLDGIDYGDRRCDSYDPEWIIPLNQEELETIDENNYWEVPPARLGISSWAEWYPCPGTIYDMFMNVIEYAISKGIEFGSTEEGLQRYGNTFNIGFYDTLNYNADRQLASQEKDLSWNNYIIQGSDGSIKYHIV